MALETGKLKNDIINAYKTVRENSGNKKAEESATELAELLSNAIELFVKSGVVSFQSGNVTGVTADPQTGTPVPLANGTAINGKIN